MNKADKEMEIIAWMNKQGYDRRASKDVAPIIVEYLIQHSANTPVSGSLPLDKVDQLLKMQIEECRYFAQRCARDYGAASADYDKWIAETPMITLHRQ